MFSRRTQGCDPAQLEALLSAIYAARLATGIELSDVARAARSARVGREPLRDAQLLLLGLATRFTAGYAAAAPTLSKALGAYRNEEPRLDLSSLSYNIVAMELWDDQAWLELASGQAELARATGTLSLLPYALDYLAEYHIQAGDLRVAAGVLTEREGLEMGLKAETLPYVPLLLAVWRGQASTALELIEEMSRGAHARGEGCAITVAEYAAAILYNSLGQYELALDAAQKAASTDEIAISSWALYELAEAASRNGSRDVARAAVDQLSERTRASGTNWARGTWARSRALVEDGQSAEDFHRQAIDWLGQCGMRTHLARARLTFGEWLRRANRRVDAREQLRSAYDLLTSIGADRFAERARRELIATGETVRKRREDTRDQLTPHEEHIARLAREGRTNQEIGAELFISDRTVEWHLRKVFAKLGISSRMGLHDALPSRSREVASA